MGRDIKANASEFKSVETDTLVEKMASVSVFGKDIAVALEGLVGGWVGGGQRGDKADSNSARSPRASSICISC